MAEAGRTAAVVQHNLNHMNPASFDAALGDCIYGLINAYNDLAEKYAALLAHLDAANVANIGNTNGASFGPSYPSLQLPDQRTPSI